jgi:hypothetical protein
MEEPGTLINSAVFKPTTHNPKPLALEQFGLPLVFSLRVCRMFCWGGSRGRAAGGKNGKRNSPPLPQKVVSLQKQCEICSVLITVMHRFELHSFLSRCSLSKELLNCWLEIYFVMHLWGQYIYAPVNLFFQSLSSTWWQLGLEGLSRSAFPWRRGLPWSFSRVRIGDSNLLLASLDRYFEPSRC